MVREQTVNLSLVGSIPTLGAIISGSSKGRTTGFDPVNWGSNPCPEAILEIY